MKLCPHILGAQVLAVMAVDVGDEGVKIPPVPDVADVSHILISIAEFVGVHPNPGQEDLADVGAVHKAQDFRQLFQGEIRVQQIVDGFSNTHFTQQVEEGQAGGAGDVGADGRFAHEKDFGKIGQGNLLVQMGVQVEQDLTGVNGFGGSLDLLRVLGADKADDDFNQLVGNV